MNYPNSVSVLRDCMKNETLAKFFRERQATLSHSLPLETYLLKPVQRILKYHLLLQELAKHFDKSAEGYEMVKEAIITMMAVAWYINDMKRKQEQAMRLQEIQNALLNWKGPDLIAFGELVLEGTFRVQRAKKERTLFLFDKMLLITKKKAEQYTYSLHIFCCNLTLSENVKDSLSFRLTDLTVPRQQHTLQAKNQEEKRLWIHYLKRLIVENHPASIPQKARQVLLENHSHYSPDTRLSPEPLKKVFSSSHLDDSRGCSGGRRQSEPPTFIYSPERTKKIYSLLTMENPLSFRRGRRQSEPSKQIQAVIEQTGSSLKYTGSEDDLMSNMETLSLLGSASTLASSVLELEMSAESEPTDTTSLELLSPYSLAGSGGLAEPGGPSKEQEEDPSLYGEPEFCGIGSIDLEMEQIFVGMECLQKKAPDDLHDIVEEKPPQCRASSLDDSFMDVAEDHSPVDLSSASKAKESGRCGLEPCEDPRSGNKRIPSLQNLEDLGELDHESQSGQVPEGNGSGANAVAGRSDDGSEAQNLQLSNDGKSIHSRDSKACPSNGRDSSTVNSHEVPIESENHAMEEMVSIEMVPSSVPGDGPETTKGSTKDSLRMEDDRLLIEKIKNYYEAEMSVDPFYLQRRESISFIPTGVVRDSILRFNYKVTHERIEESHDDRAGSGEPAPRPSTLPSSGPESLRGGSKSRSPPFPDQEEPKGPPPGPSSPCNAGESEAGTEFRSCTEIIKVWREMEKVAHFWSSCHQVTDIRKTSPELRGMNVGEPLLILEDPDLHSTAEIPGDSPAIGKEPPEEDQDPRSSAEPHNCAPCCHGSQLLCQGANGCLLQNTEKIMNKVQLLAKMYNQRISRKKAPMQRRVWELGPEAKQRRRRQATNLCRAQECQHHQTYDSVQGLEPAAGFGHLIVREPVPLLYAQENSIWAGAFRDKSSPIPTAKPLMGHISPANSRPTLSLLDVLSPEPPGTLLDVRRPEAPGSLMDVPSPGTPSSLMDVPSPKSPVSRPAMGTEHRLELPSSATWIFHKHTPIEACSMAQGPGSVHLGGRLKVPMGPSPPSPASSLNPPRVDSAETVLGPGLGALPYLVTQAPDSSTGHPSGQVRERVLARAVVSPEEPVIGSGVPLLCAASDLCCPLPSWVSLRGRSPSPSAIKQLEQWIRQPKGAHTAQPCQTPGAQPCQTPGAQPCQTPGAQPCQTPGAQPCQTPGAQPCQTPGAQPCPTPGAQPCPTPGAQPCPTPGAQPCPTPGAQPCPTPGAQPCPTPGAQPCQTPGAQPCQTPGAQPCQTPGAQPCPSSGTHTAQPCPSMGAQPCPSSGTHSAQPCPTLRTHTTQPCLSPSAQPCPSPGTLNAQPCPSPGTLNAQPCPSPGTLNTQPCPSPGTLNAQPCPSPGIHTTKPCPSLDTQPLTPMESRSSAAKPRARPGTCPSLRLRSPSPYRGQNRAELPPALKSQRPGFLPLCSGPPGQNEPALGGYRTTTRGDQARPGDGAGSLPGKGMTTSPSCSHGPATRSWETPGNSLPCENPAFFLPHPHRSRDWDHGLQSSGPTTGLRSPASPFACQCPRLTSPSECSPGVTQGTATAPREPCAPPAEDQEPLSRPGRGGVSPGEAERAHRPAGGSQGAGGRASYSTTVSLQIGGGGRPATISKAQVSLTQTFLPAATRSPRRVTGTIAGNSPAT
ncbi:pleckstrin homology domain-containing family G member 3-like isoform X2 [Narcine bancroftii]